VNYYEHTFHFAELYPPIDSYYVGDLYFTEEEEKEMEEEFYPFKSDFNIILPISGSGLNKVYPYWEEIFSNLYKKHKNIKVFTVGDDMCRLLEWGDTKVYVEERSAKWPVRKAMLATKYADLVVSTDTGILHAAGCFDTPKICILGHSTPENISKHFRGQVINLCSDVPCAPCFRIIYNSQIFCPRYEPIGSGCLCMTGLWDYHSGEFMSGIHPQAVENAILEVIDGRT
jgi:ADP-heptose:LPS heptosyltransferase